MKIKFDVNGTIPSREEIKIEKSRINKNFIISLIVGGFLTACGFIWLYYNNPNSFYIIFVGVLIFVHGTYNRIEVYSNLSDIVGLNCEYALKLCKEHTILDEYRQNVIHSNRNLTNSEYQMMLNWAKKANENASFKALHS